MHIDEFPPFLCYIYVRFYLELALGQIQIYAEIYAAVITTISTLSWNERFYPICNFLFKHKRIEDYSNNWIFFSIQSSGGDVEGICWAQIKNKLKKTLFWSSRYEFFFCCKLCYPIPSHFTLFDALIFSGKRILSSVMSVIFDVEPSYLCRAELAFHLWVVKVGPCGDNWHIECRTRG